MAPRALALPSCGAGPRDVRAAGHQDSAGGGQQGPRASPAAQTDPAAPSGRSGKHVSEVLVATRTQRPALGQAGVSAGFLAAFHLCVFQLPLKTGQPAPRNQDAHAKLLDPSSAPFQAPKSKPNLSFPVLVTIFPTSLG